MSASAVEVLGLRQHTRVLKLGPRLPGFKSTHIHIFFCPDEGLYVPEGPPVPWPIPMYVPPHTLFCRGGGLYK